MLGVFTSALALFVGFVLFLVAGIASSLTSFASAILQWVASDNFISLSYTNAGLTINDANFNQFVSIGWELTRGLTNIIFVLALVAIGLMTALGIGGEAFKAKKALPVLIAVALLINFTPIILGLLIDASNIVMNFFLQGVGGFDFFSTIMSNAVESVKTTVTKFFDPTASIGAVIKLLAMIVVSLVAALIFFVFSALFAIRYVALWILVILSPLAFAFYILPETRKWWTQWWQQFLQWNFIGVIGAFFLYLTSKMIEMTSGISGPGGKAFWQVTAADPGGGVGYVLGDWQSLATTILPWGIIIAVMFIGLTMSFQTSAMGASQIVNWTQKAGKRVGGLAATQTAGRLLSTKWGSKALTSIAKGKLGVPETREDWKKASAGKKFLGGLTALGAYPARWALRAGAKPALEYAAKQPQAIDAKTAAIEKKFGKTPGGIAKAAATYGSISPADWQEKIAMGQYLAKNGGAKGLGLLRDESLQDIIKTTARYDGGKLGEIIKHKPALIDDPKVGQLIQNTMTSDGLKRNKDGTAYEDDDVEELVKLGVDQEKLIIKATFKKAVDAIKTSDLETLDRKLADNSEFQEAVARFKPWNFVHKMMDEWGANVSEKIQSKAEDVGLDKIAESNPTLIRAPYTPAGRMFMREWKNIKENKDINEDGAKELVREAVARVKTRPTPPPTQQTAAGQAGSEFGKPGITDKTKRSY